MAIKKVREKKTPAPEGYKASVNIWGRITEAQGPTVYDAIANLKPGIAKGRGILTLSRGEKHKERIMLPFVTSRLFNSAGLTRQVALKNISLLFDGFDT